MENVVRGIVQYLVVFKVATISALILAFLLKNKCIKYIYEIFMSNF